jgi:hypothetical protein
MSAAMRLWATFLMVAGCATAPEVRDERPPVPLEPVAVRPVFIPEKDELFALIDPLKPLAEEKLSSMGHAISDRGWPIEINLRTPEMGLKDEHARVCVRLIGRVVRPQGRFASIDVPAEACREANVYNPVNVISISAADIPNAPNGALYVEALRLLLESLSRQARVPAGSSKTP